MIDGQAGYLDVLSWPLEQHANHGLHDAEVPGSSLLSGGLLLWSQ